MTSKESSNEKLYLLKFKQENVDKTYLWIQDLNLRTMFMMRGEPNVIIHEQYFKKVLSDPHQHWYAIYINERHIGNCGLKWNQEDRNIGTIWIYIGDQNYLNKGYGTAATKILIEKAFNEYKMSYLILHVAQYNSKAIGMYKKLGFFEIPLDQKETEWKNREYKVIKMQLTKRDFF